MLKDTFISMYIEVNEHANKQKASKKITTRGNCTKDEKHRKNENRKNCYSIVISRIRFIGCH
jgi:hypothetical protein